MKGSAFITHAAGWCCSNKTDYDMISEPNIGPSGNIESIKNIQSLVVEFPFGELPQLDAECDFVFKPEDVNTCMGFKGRVKSIKPSLIITVVSPIPNHKPILDRIKNNIGI